MTNFIIKKLLYDLTSNADFSLMGHYMTRLDIGDRVDHKFPVSSNGIANSDIIKSHLGLLVQSKTHFDAI